MVKVAKKMKAALATLGDNQECDFDKASAMLKEIAFAKYDETIDLCVRLGVDPRHADQNIRGAVVLPHGTGKDVRVIVFARGEKVKEAEAAGAIEVGGEELVKKIQGGWFDFDKAVATPDMMAVVGRIGRVLGPRGLMPNPKVGTVTMNVAQAVSDLRGGKVEYRVDKGGNVHARVGRVSFDANQIAENARALLDALVRARPASVKGSYVRRITMSSTQGPGIAVSTGEAARSSS
ncbi:MAG: 50S ribosomal protein L1 [Myxococcota bacterium]|jgi:large subunit ribosomal protein L1|nr:50S ribosomal protein L1 [Myxococcota bacterium]